MKIALIGPGYMPIPTDGWGAVESIIWQYYLRLTTLGHEVTVINEPNLLAVVDCINNNPFDFVHCQYDNHLGFIKSRINKPIVGTHHYGWIKTPHLWDGGYYQIFKDGLAADGLFCLSHEIQKLFQKYNYSGFSTVIRNGAPTKLIKTNTSPQKDAIVIGKIETRKQQAELARLCEGRVNIDFVGPIVDNSFKENSTCKYLGTWTREQLYSLLSDYRCLVLLSDGEAAPLVVPEALSAGLNVVLTETAAANLDRSLPFIDVLSDGVAHNNINISHIIQNNIENNREHRYNIRYYAEQNFDWDLIVLDYVQAIHQFLKR